MLLELGYQYEAESVDPFLEDLLAEAWWNHDEGDRPPAADWRENPKYRSHLDAYPALTDFLSAAEPARAVFDWAGLSEDERDVFERAAEGYTLDAIASRYGVRLATVETRLRNAHSRIQTALEFSVRARAV